VAGDFSDLGDFDGDLLPDTVTFTSGTSTTAIQFTGGVANTSNQYAMLGHGGTGNLGNHGGAIDVTARRTISFVGGAGTRGFAQLGHGGYGAIATTGHSGSVFVRATGEGAVTANLVFTPGIGLESYTQLGHGGLGALGDHAGSILVQANNAITFNANSGTIVNGYRGYAQIGHGGLGAAGDHSGDIAVTANLGAIAFTGGNATGEAEADDRYAQIGHGGRNAAGDHSGNIAVLSQTGVTFLGGSAASRSYAQIGHGGHSAGGNGHSGNIGVAARAGLISFTSGASTSTDSYVQIGHGGLAAGGDHSGGIVVRSGNNLLLSGSAGLDTLIPDPVDPVNNPPTRIDHRGYAQIGHGGLLAEGDRSGDITVTAQIDGDFTDIGDLDGDGFNDTVSLVAGTSTEGLLINGGTATGAGATDAYAQIGHGGRLARGTNEGDIAVDALRQIRVVAGQLGARTYAQVGHGGSDAAAVGAAAGTLVNEGDISLTSRTGLVDFRWTAADTVTSAGTYVQLGHGGQITDPLLSGITAGGDNVGDIRVSAGTNLLFRSTTGGTTAAGTTTPGNYVQLGHGGLRWAGNHSGDVEVRAGAAGATGTITFQAGDSANSHGDGVSEGGTDRYAQLGHGGNFAAGSHSGDIDVLSRGTLLVIGGRNPRSHSQIGHGGYLAGGGGNEGDIRVASETGNVEVRFSVDGTSTTATTDTPGFGSYAQIGHGGFDTIGGNRGDISVLAGGNILIRSPRGNFPTGNLGNQAQIGHGGFRAEGNHSGSITVRAGTGGSIADLFDLDNDGSRDAVAFTSNNVGTLQILSGAGGSDRYAQIGHGGRLARGDHGAVDLAGNALDTIRVTALGDISITSRGGTRGYSQIGNGGHDADLETNPRGAAANLIVTSINGSVLATGSTGDSAYAHLGNGGYTTSGSHRGDILVEAGTNVTFSAAQSLTGTTGNGYVQLGHGGRAAVGDHAGDVVVRAGTGGSAGAVTFLGGRASERYAQLGHGGRSANGDHRGDITVESWGDIVFQGADYRAFTNTSSPNVATAAINGDGAAGLKLPTLAYIRPGSLSITIALPLAPEYGTIIDDGKGNLLDGNGVIVGTINYANADVAFSAPIANAGSTATSTYQESNFSRSYAQLGHGGSDTTAVVGSSGDIRVVAGLGGATGNINFKAGPGNESYAQIGHGGRAGRGDHSGDLYVDALGHVTFNGNQGLRNYAQLGHGGWDADLNTAGSEDRGSSGDIFVNTRGLVTSTGDIRFTAGGGEEAYAQLGHGGFGTRGAASGKLAGLNRIDVRSGGDIIFISGDASGFGDDTLLRTANGRRAYAQLGHGGYDADAHNVDASGYEGLGHQADIVVNAGGVVRFESATLVSDPLGVVNGPIAADFRNYVQLGHGGLASSGDHRGDITVRAGTGIEFQGGRVAAGATANDGADSYAQLGHGGYTSPGYGGNDTISFSGNIDVSATTGDIRFLGGNTTDGYVQLGHGGRAATGGSTGGILVTASAGGILFQAGERAQHYAQLGHGGYNARGDHSGDIGVTSQNDLVFTGGAGAQTYAQLGHGGYDADNPNPTHYPDNDPLNPVRGPTAAERVGNSGAITVESKAGSLLFSSGSANNTYTQIGHGGSLTDGDHTGDIIARAALDIRFDASNPVGTLHPSQIGHGGYLASGGFTGDVAVEAGGAIVFTGGATSWVQIGHGGRNDHRLSTTAPNNNNNDRYYPGTHRGDISVNAGGDLLFDAYQFPVGGATGSGGYAQIGHGGFRNAAMLGEGHSGDIDVLSGGLLRFRAGPRAQANAQIGHGGFEAFGDHGRLTVRAESGAGILAATQGGSANLANGGVAAGSVRVTIGGSVMLDDDGLGGLRDATGAVVATIDYASGAITFTGNVNAGGDPVEVFYQHGRSDIFVQARDGVEFLGDALTEVSADQAYVQIGHGGYDADFQIRTLAAEGVTAGGVHHLNTPTGTPQGTSGHITVLAGVNALGTVLNPNAAIRFIAGGDDDSYAQLGNGGRATSGSHQGDITVRSTAGITFEAGNFQPESYAQLGHGGLGATSPGQALAPGGAAITIGHRGTISVAAGLGGTSGGITFRAGSSNATGDNYAQLGHGGRSATGNHIGDIDVSAWGSILFQGGGYRSLSGTTSAGLTTAAQTGASGQLLTTANIRPGHLVISIAEPADVAYATIIDDGNGNLLDANGVIVGTINYFSATVTFTTAVSNAGGAVTADYDHFNYARNYVQLGNGGSGATANLGHGGDISVVAGLGGIEGDIVFNAGVNSDGYAQLGQGGNVAPGDHFGDIRIDALGDLRFTGEFNLRAYAQLGNGGYNSDLNTANANNPWGVDSAVGNRGDIFVNTRTNLLTNTGGVFFTAGGGEESSAQLGHGGFANRGVNQGTIDVRAAGDIVFRSGDGSGRGDDTGASRFGDGRRSFAHLGHGGYDADAHNVAGEAIDGLGHSGNLVVMSGGSIQFIATDIVSDPTGATAGPIANDFRNYVHLGHGGFASNGDHRGDITVVAGTGIEFRSGA
jgi:mucin-19